MKPPAVALIVYRRPQLARALVASLASSRPEVLWIIADGPASRHEEGLCRETREAVEAAVTWPCQLKRVYADENLGLRKRVETGLDALFADESKAVILEEDCHPEPDFIPFCSAMLDRYQGEERVAGISGPCFLPAGIAVGSSYFFSRYLQIWGWATWARAWNSYDRAGWRWPEEGFRTFFPDADLVETRYWNRIYQRVSTGEIQTWDYPWVAHLWARQWVSITPCQNLVTNRGFGPEATHTKDPGVKVGIERQERLPPPYQAPPGEIRADAALDRAVFRNHCLRTEGRRNLWQKLRDRVFGKSPGDA